MSLSTKSNRTFVLVLLFLVLPLLAFAGGSAEKESDLTEVTLQIEGSAVPYYMPIFWAIEAGYFNDEGLEVDYLFGSADDATRNVGVGNVEFGFPNGEPVIMARSSDVPIVVTHTTLQNGLGSTIYLEESGIETPKDLKGKTVAITSYGSPNYVQLQVLLKQNGMTEDDINIEIIGTEAIVPALVEGEVDAIVFSMLRTFELKSQGIEVDEFPSSEFLPSFGNVVVTSEKYLEENEDVVRSFNRALSRSMEDLSDKEKVKEIAPTVISEYTPTYEGREDYMADVIYEVYAGYLWNSEKTEEHGYGYNDPEAWQETIDLMHEYDILEQKIDADSIVPIEGILE